MSITNHSTCMSHEASPAQTGSRIITCEVMSPVEIKRGGQGLAIQYGFGPTPIGDVLVGWTSRGVCHFAFMSSHHNQLVSDLKAYWPQAQFMQNDQGALNLLNMIFPLKRLGEPYVKQGNLHLLLKGTPFQIKVWQALIQIDLGRAVSYKQLALQAGYPNAARAVGNALGANRIGFLLPCHRVIRENGETGHYRWGDTRKKVLLAWESAQIGIDT
jgi:AraC family transcriptional regulator, regulatory protein of adaptative response / methylated-DNA-[protein]-cysteine methyltransferase